LIASLQYSLHFLLQLSRRYSGIIAADDFLEALGFDAEHCLVASTQAAEAVVMAKL